MSNAEIVIPGCLGVCGDRPVFIGFAAAGTLVRLSFADTFEESRNSGYQRPFNRAHSVEFKKYIQQPGATTIPLTFNLRESTSKNWRIVERDGSATLHVRSEAGPVMAQVDCQHRLGFLADSEIPFAFMAFLSLDVRDEISIFRDINGKAKGLSSSLLDSTEAQLAGDRLLRTNPELYFAIQLSDSPSSPWFGKLDKGGKPTVGMLRPASIRTMQNAVRRFFKAIPDQVSRPHAETTDLLIAFWNAIALVLPDAWREPRKHVICKGVGVYALSSLAADLVLEARRESRACDLDFFVARLSDFLHTIDWTNDGVMKGYGGARGASTALELLRHTRSNARTTTKNHGKQKHPAH